MTPKPHDLVIADHLTNGGEVRVHNYTGGRHPMSGERTARCGKVFDGPSRAWSWLPFQSLNPVKVRLCKRGCWKEGK